VKKISTEQAKELKTPVEWAFKILENWGESSSGDDFYNIVLYAEDIARYAGAPEEIQEEIAEVIVVTIENLFTDGEEIW